MKNYDHSKIEKKWQKQWESKKVYKTQSATKKKKFYVLDMFPYPSGAGLHVGHPRGYIGSDVYARMKRMQGYNVLHPMGYDAFGLPAEQYAIEHKIHPKKAVDINVKTFERQLSVIGLSYDWSRKVNTTDPRYYKWTQWIFLQIYNSWYDNTKNKARSIDDLIKIFEKSGNTNIDAVCDTNYSDTFSAKEWKNFSEKEKQNVLMKYRLAYEGYALVNWCPKLGTVLANDEIVEDKDGNFVSERGGYPVEKISMRQWFMRITAYADRLLSDLEGLNWSSHIKEIQKNWIGKSIGSEIEFKTNININIKVFTTRADTLFGVTYVVISPEHENIDEFMSQSKNIEEVSVYVREAKERLKKDNLDQKEKTGIQLKGITATNPANNEEVPVWVADYVLASYGTGAVMAVPAHDERDYEFAKKYNLPIKEVIEPLYIDTSEQSKPREGLPFIEREVIDVIVKHWSEDKYLCLKWKKVDWKTFVTGGVEKGQTPEEASRMEVREESGYLDLKFIKEIGRYHSKFFHNPKNLNRFAHFHGMYFELQSDKREEMVDEEKEKHDLFWIPKEDVAKFVHEESSARIWSLLMNPDQIYTGEGLLANSSKYNNFTSEEARLAITKAVGGKIVTKYKMRDAIFARQRYWGEPIPLKRDKDTGIIKTLKEKDLPLTLPNVTSYEPTGTGESPLASVKSWTKEGYETNTMPGWAGSSWYFLRYMDPSNSKEFASKKSLTYWKDVDMYVGGQEHATGHLLYSRFWHKFLYDMGYVPTKEPFKTLKNQGLIIASDGRKMSKRWGNVINPDEIVKTYGADTLRVYEMFMGPFDQTVSWSTESIIGSRRFIERVYRLKDKVVKKYSQDSNLEKVLHKTIKKVTEDIDTMSFNTAISSMMMLVNESDKSNEISLSNFKDFLKILSPFAPHIAEELWNSLGESKSINISSWPIWDKKKIIDDVVKIVVQVNGKVRAEISMPLDIPEEQAKEIALKDKSILSWISNTPVKRVIYVKNRLINIVI
jgi:leucyl-tRNA synthetase